MGPKDYIKIWLIKGAAFHKLLLFDHILFNHKTVLFRSVEKGEYETKEN